MFLIGQLQQYSVRSAGRVTYIEAIIMEVLLPCIKSMQSEEVCSELIWQGELLTSLSMLLFGGI